MTGHGIAAGAVALSVAVVGFHLAFRQRLVRRLWSIARRRAGAEQGPAPTRLPDDQDPVHYALIISGTMIMAFGIIIFIAMIRQGP
jgi:hypothetical protein